MWGWVKVGCGVPGYNWKEEMKSYHIFMFVLLLQTKLGNPTSQKIVHDRQMEGRTDTPSFRDARTHLKSGKKCGSWRRMKKKQGKMEEDDDGEDGRVGKD